MTPRLLWALCWTASALRMAASGLAQEPFYKDKTIRIIVGLSPGGGFNTFSRTMEKARRSKFLRLLFERAHFRIAGALMPKPVEKLLVAAKRNSSTARAIL